MKEVVLATGNAGKVKEFDRLLAPLGFKVTSQTELGVSEADEPYLTFVENALTKARHASRHTNRPALADDSGLCVAALGGAPGVQSARYAGLDIADRAQRDAANNQKLMAALVNQNDRRAWFVACLVWVEHPDDPLPIIAQATWAGQIVDTAQGHYGFGYDPHFYIPTLFKTAAAITPEEKNRYSHRAQATAILIDELMLRGQLNPPVVAPNLAT
jgi:XTP/dITP diphosphohydrolase